MTPATDAARGRGRRLVGAVAPLRAWSWLVGAVVLTAWAGGCVEERTEPGPDLVGFRVNLAGADPQGYGTKDAAQPFPTAFASGGACPCAKEAADGTCLETQTCKTLYLDIEALRPDGTRATQYGGNVRLRAVPGEIAPEDVLIRLEAGHTAAPAGVPVRVRYTFGETRIWAEDAGDPDSGVDECHDGIDNDGNGLTDFPRDPSCDEGDRDEGSGTWLTGISDALYFELPTIRSVQENPDSKTGPSPLVRQYVEVQSRPGHDLVVTNVVGTGFYVTDLGEQSYGSIFIFNFSYPEGVEIGDRVCDVGGGVVEFNALTQMQFPSWGLQGKPRTLERRVPNPEDEEDQLIEGQVDIVDCSSRFGLTPYELSETLPLPTPVMLTGEMIRDLALMERLEGSLVTVENIELSDFFINCDDNGSGRIESGTPESVCRSECNDDPYCTELSSLYGFEQWRGRVQGAEISVSSTELVAGFDVLEGCTEGRTAEGRQTFDCLAEGEPRRRLRRVTGSLRQIVPTCDRFLPCDPVEEGIILFIIDPRFPTDIVE